MEKKLEIIIKGLASMIKDVECPCCGEFTSTGSAVNDEEDEYRDIVTCDVNDCNFYLTEYTDGSYKVEVIK